MPAVQLVIDCRNPRPLVTFWCLALDYVPSPPPEDHDTWNDRFTVGLIDPKGNEFCLA